MHSRDQTLDVRESVKGEQWENGIYYARDQAKPLIDPADTVITIETDKIILATSVRNRGVHWDSEMKNTIHFNKLSSSLFVTIKNISKIRPNLDIDTTWTLRVGLLQWHSGWNVRKEQGKIAENTECVMSYHAVFSKV